MIDDGCVRAEKRVVAKNKNVVRELQERCPDNSRTLSEYCKNHHSILRNTHNSVFHCLPDVTICDSKSSVVSCAFLCYIPIISPTST